jgi:hypothetical protein
MRKNLFAYTSPGVNYPSFLSINTEDGAVEIIVRSPAKADGSCGDVAGIKLTAEQFDQFVVDIQK